MQVKNCTYCSDEKCTAADLEICDFAGENFKECLRYKLQCLRPQLMQLR